MAELAENDRGSAGCELSRFYILQWPPVYILQRPPGFGPSWRRRSPDDSARAEFRDQGEELSETAESLAEYDCCSDRRDPAIRVPVLRKASP